jgi:hypothetical protein
MYREEKRQRHAYILEQTQNTDKIRLHVRIVIKTHAYTRTRIVTKIGARGSVVG